MNHIPHLLMDQPSYYVDCDKMFEISTHREIVSWLNKYNGKGFSLGGSGVYFYDPKDATMFALRWS